MSKLRVGVIGLGEVAQVIHLPIIESLPDHYELAAVCDISPGLLKRVGDRYRVERRYADVGEMLERERPDIVDNDRLRVRLRGRAHRVSIC